MTLKFQNKGKIAKYFLITLIIFCGLLSVISDEISICAQNITPNPNLIESQSFSTQIANIRQRLIKTTKKEWVKIFGEYTPIVANNVEFKRLYRVSWEKVDALLDKAVADSIDSLTLFTLPILQNQKSFAIVFNERILEQIKKNYDFHALFNLSAVSIEDDAIVRMKFLVIGQGKLIVGYNRNAKIRHSDYDFVTGKYDYKELFTMDSRKDSEGNPGLFNIKGISNPNENPQWMKGPINVDIQTMVLITSPNGRKQALIHYDLFGIKHKIVDLIPIEKLKGE